MTLVRGSRQQSLAPATIRITQESLITSNCQAPPLTEGQSPGLGPRPLGWRWKPQERSAYFSLKTQKSKRKLASQHCSLLSLSCTLPASAAAGGHRGRRPPEPAAHTPRRLHALSQGERKEMLRLRLACHHHSPPLHDLPTHLLLAGRRA